MKTSTLVTLFLLPFVSQSQHSQKLFKGANTILIETAMDRSEAFTRWGRHLAQNGYSIDKSDNAFYSLTTGPKDTSRSGYDFLVNSSVTDSGTIIITIKWRSKSSSETPFDDWQYKPGKANIRSMIFRDIIPIINSLGDFDIYYEKR